MNVTNTRNPELLFIDQESASKRLRTDQSSILMVLYQDPANGEIREFRFQSPLHESTDQPLFFGTKNGVCGEYIPTAEGGDQFHERGHLNDPLSCMLATHLQQELSLNAGSETTHIAHISASLMSYMTKKHWEYQEFKKNNFQNSITKEKLWKIEAYITDRISQTIHISELAQISGMSVFR